MSDAPADALSSPITVAADGLTVRLVGPDGGDETEAHMPRRMDPVEETAVPAETEAHMPFRKGVPAETEAHGFRLSPADPAIDAMARLTLSFPPDAPEQAFEVRYRPASTPDGAPEVELHGKGRCC